MPDLLPNLNVSRETMDRLTHFSGLLEKWTRKINLIAPNSVSSIWDRHILDSAQTFPLLSPDTMVLADLGSGGGLPAIVLSTLFRGQSSDALTVMVESDTRKSTFLRTAIRELGLNAEVRADRIDEVPPIGADVVTARALAPLAPLLGMVQRHLAPNGTAILSKGRNHKQEIDSARKNWHMNLVEHHSLTDPEARLLEIKDIMRVTP